MVAEQQQQEEIYYGAIEIDERPSHSTDSNRSSENRNGLFVQASSIAQSIGSHVKTLEEGRREGERGGKERGREALTSGD